MLSAGEMCILLPNLKSNYSKFDQICYVNNILKQKLSTKRCLFGSNFDSNNNISNTDFANKLLDEQFQIDRERILNRYNFDILDVSKSKTSYQKNKIISINNNVSSDESRVLPKREIRLDENVNIEYEDEELKITIEDRLTSQDEHIEERTDKTNFKSSPCSPTKSKSANTIESRKHPYTTKKQSHLTDFWKIKRHSLDLTTKKASSKLLQEDLKSVALEKREIS